MVSGSDACGPLGCCSLATCCRVGFMRPYRGVELGLSGSRRAGQSFPQKSRGFFRV